MVIFVKIKLIGILTNQYVNLVIHPAKAAAVLKKITVQAVIKITKF